MNTEVDEKGYVPSTGLLDPSLARFTGNTMGQIFLHYVVAGGQYANEYFDGNPQRFPPSISEGLVQSVQLS